MNTVIIVLSAIIVICIILIILLVAYNRLQGYIIRINEADLNIDAVLRKRFDLLNKSSEVIKENVNTDEEILKMIDELRSKKLSNFEFDNNLYDAINEFHVLKDKYPELQKSDEFIKIEINLMESESEIVALRKYYNDIAVDYNKYIKKFPYNILALIKKYKVKDYFENNKLDKKGTIKF